VLTNPGGTLAKVSGAVRVMADTEHVIYSVNDTMSEPLSSLSFQLLLNTSQCVLQILAKKSWRLKTDTCAAIRERKLMVNIPAESSVTKTIAQKTNISLSQLALRGLSSLISHPKTRSGNALRASARKALSDTHAGASKILWMTNSRSTFTH
jgi:hypothetical protein